MTQPAHICRMSVYEEYWRFPNKFKVGSQNLMIEQVFINFGVQKSEFSRSMPLFVHSYKISHFFFKTRQKYPGKIYLSTEPNDQTKLDP